MDFSDQKIIKYLILQALHIWNSQWSQEDLSEL